VEEERLKVGAVIRRVFDIYVDQAAVLMPASAAVIGLTGILYVLLEHAGTGTLLLADLVRLVAVTVFTGMVVELVADLQDGKRDATVRKLLSSVMPVVGSLIAVSLVAGLGILVGFILIIIPGLILITIWSVIAPVVVLEHPPGLGALGRSRDLVRGDGWQVFGVLVFLYLLVTVVSLLLIGAATAGSVGLGIVVSVVISVLTVPLEALAAAVLYFELKRLKGARGVGPSEPIEPVSVPPGGIPEAPQQRDY